MTPIWKSERPTLCHIDSHSQSQKHNHTYWLANCHKGSFKIVTSRYNKVNPDKSNSLHRISLIRQLALSISSISNTLPFRRSCVHGVGQLREELRFGSFLSRNFGRTEA